ncbi:MAG: hypothetical protein JWL83_3017 [Actinomycetia bacterium]|nr:hypothetical protein [Actinomycetes bacterium]
MSTDDIRDTRRQEIAAQGLTPAAVAHLTRDALGRIDFERLAPLKRLLKRFFSPEPWTAAEDGALADLVGPGDGWWQHDLDDGSRLEFGWRGGAFRIDLSAPSLDETFGGPVTPEATPNPRTIRFVTGPIHEGPSRWYESVGEVDDPRVTSLFDASDDVANVLVGPDFVAVGLRRPDRWESMLVPMLRLVTAQFTATSPDAAPLVARDGDTVHASAPSASRVDVGASEGRSSALERAWQQFGTLHPDQPDDVREIVAAASSSESAVRQVAARLLVGAEPAPAEATWARLLHDPSRSVRRAVVDAMVDAERPSLRPLLEIALRDSDAWARWKALRGLVELGIAPSRDAVAALVDDPDFRVRLEAAGALRLP